MNKQVITIKDIAEITGLSIATVSRVMNHPDKVRRETYEKVQAAMEQYGYHPNHLARGLILGETHTIALLVPGIEQTNCQMILSGVETVSSARGYNVLLCNTHGDADTEYAYITMAVNKGVDGVIISSSSLKYKQTKILEDSKIPFIHIGKKNLLGCDNRCYIDHEKDAARLTGHLKSMGHDNIVLVVNEETKETREQIINGFCSALSRNADDLQNRIFSCENSFEGGLYIVSKILQEHSSKVAILASTDYQALGILKAAQENHLKVPDDLAIACMNDSLLCSLASPPLTCISAPFKRLGMVAARMLIDSLVDNDTGSVALQDIVLQSALKIRKSCGNTKNIYELFE